MRSVLLVEETRVPREKDPPFNLEAIVFFPPVRLFFTHKKKYACYEFLVTTDIWFRPINKNETENPNSLAPVDSSNMNVRFSYRSSLNHSSMYICFLKTKQAKIELIPISYLQG